MYISLVSAGYVVFLTSVPPLLPNAFVSEVHLYVGARADLPASRPRGQCSALTRLPRAARHRPRSVLGPLATASGLVLFFLTCFSDPGTVTAANVDVHLAAQPFDGALYAPKRCPTMRLTAPARSKFCRVTNRRVARFDHYCGWMNNAIGENNYRFFLGFLAWHVVLCAYGAGLMIAILFGEARARDGSCRTGD